MRKLTILLLIVCPFVTTAQGDSSILHEAFSNAINTSTSNTPLFNGKEHLGYPPTYIGIPYYMTNDWLPGSVVYSDVTYKNLQLKYDLLKNEVIVKHSNTYTSVSLFTPRVQSFTIGGRSFFQVFMQEKNLLPPGVYEELQTGKMNLYVSRSKLIEENITSGGVDKIVVDKNAYYVVLNGASYQIKKQKNILDLLGNKKGAIKTHLKDSGFNFKANREATLIEIAKYYNQ